ncbi:MAG: TetR/AcrR family transcriptional regulator [Bacteroidales bacterium]|nr:TetR/AcrR family transcriptional regulator [Bacteroidales bacterium]
MDIKDKILENTTNFFIKGGCRKVTMDEIASYNGISKRTLYENFNDKADLIFQCIKYCDKKSKDGFCKSFSTPTNIMEMVMKGPYSHENEKIIRVMNFFEEVKTYYPDVFSSVFSEIKLGHREALTNLIREGQQNGQIIDTISEKGIVLGVEKMMKIVGDNDFITDENMTKDEIYKYFIMVYFRGISTEKGREIIDNFLNKQ